MVFVHVFHHFVMGHSTRRERERREREGRGDDIERYFLHFYIYIRQKPYFFWMVISPIHPTKSAVDATLSAMTLYPCLTPPKKMLTERESERERDRERKKV